MAEPIKNAEELLRAREARVLRVPIVMRILLNLFGVGAAFSGPIPTSARVVVCVLTSVYHLYGDQ